VGLRVGESVRVSSGQGGHTDGAGEGGRVMMPGGQSGPLQGVGAGGGVVMPGTSGQPGPSQGVGAGGGVVIPGTSGQPGPSQGVGAGGGVMTKGTSGQSGLPAHEGADDGEGEAATKGTTGASVRGSNVEQIVGAGDWVNVDSVPSCLPGDGAGQAQVGAAVTSVPSILSYCEFSSLLRLAHLLVAEVGVGLFVLHSCNDNK